MTCPRCSDRMTVTDSRAAGQRRVRVYRCACGEHLYTAEQPVSSATGRKALWVIEQMRKSHV